MATVKAELIRAGAAAATSCLLRRQGSTRAQNAAAALVGFLAYYDEATSAELVAAGVVTSLMEVASEDRKMLQAVAALLHAVLASDSDEEPSQLNASVGCWGTSSRCGCGSNMLGQTRSMSEQLRVYV